jgi:hypothetical protein
MNRWLPPVEQVLLAAWVGGMWTVGFLVAPMLFQLLDDRALAGQLAGRLFAVMSMVGIVAATLLLASGYVRRGRAWLNDWRCRVLLAMLALILIGQFGITPRMQAIKEAAHGPLAPGSEDYARFALLHGVSSLLFLLTSILGLMLVAFGLRRSDGS